MRLERIVLREVSLPLRSPFVTSFGTLKRRHVIIVEAWDTDNQRGLGESAPISPPLYTEESVGTAWHLLVEYLAPIALKSRWEHPSHLAEAFESIRRNYTAKAGMEGALWDLFAQRCAQPLAVCLGQTRGQIETGAVIGIPTDIDALCRHVESALAAGFRRVKIKVRPGWDIEPVHRLRRRFGDFPLALDANSAYTLAEAERLQALDEYSVEMIEQPLDWEDLLDHAKLQRRLATPICLDESITSIESARHALELGSCRIVNLKVGRVGGHTAAVRIHDLCQAHNVPVWCGGLLETGIGRAHNLAIASLSNFTLPADLSPPEHYLTRDLVDPPIEFATPGCIALPEGVGIGVRLSEKRLAAHTLRSVTLTRDSLL